MGVFCGFSESGSGFLRFSGVYSGFLRKGKLFLAISGELLVMSDE